MRFEIWPPPFENVINSNQYGPGTSHFHWSSEYVNFFDAQKWILASKITKIFSEGFAPGPPKYSSKDSEFLQNQWSIFLEVRPGIHTYYPKNKKIIIYKSFRFLHITCNNLSENFFSVMCVNYEYKIQNISKFLDYQWTVNKFVESQVVMCRT